MERNLNLIAKRKKTSAEPNGTLDDSLERVDDIKVNLGDDDDERQDIRLLRYILSDYHANCSKPTFGRRRIFAVQCIGNKLTLLSTSRMSAGKWCFVELRSAIVPRDWEDRYYLNCLMELLMKLKEMLLEQEEVLEHDYACFEALLVRYNRFKLLILQ